MTLLDDVFDSCSCFRTFCASPSLLPAPVLGKSLFLRDSKLSERLKALRDELLTGLVNWKGLAECIERTGVVRGEGLEHLAMGDEWLET